MEKRYLRVLLIDDDEDEFAMLQGMLSRLEPATLHLHWTDSYESGLKGICGAEYDVYLVDYLLGEKDGLELLREANTCGIEQPIILLTGRGGYALDVEAMEAGASDYLVKGQITPDLLERSIRYSVAQKQADLELKRYRDYLEQLVNERTRELEETNGKLKSEIEIRREMEKANRQLAAIVESSDDAIVSLTLDGIILSWNKGAEVMYGYTAGEAIGQDMSFHVPDGYRREILDFLETTGRGESIFHHETLRRKKNGELIDVSLTVSPIRDDSDSITGTSCIARDITERRRQADERERLILELQEALAKVKTLRGLIPICAWCKRIRDDQGYWRQIEAYVRDHSEADFSHSICPSCAQKVSKEMLD